MRMAAHDIMAVNLTRQIAALDDGQEIAVTNMFDAFGDSTNDADEAFSVVAGPDKDGNWYAAPMSAFGGRPH